MSSENSKSSNKRKVDDKEVDGMKKARYGEEEEDDDKIFMSIIVDALTAEAKEEPLQAYLFGVDWERMGHGKGEGPGTVLVARGLADALIKLKGIGQDKIADYMDSDEVNELREACLSKVSSIKKDAIEKVINIIKNAALESDYGIRVWMFVDIPK
jgi:hypothetical protein